MRSVVNCTVAAACSMSVLVIVAFNIIRAVNILNGIKALTEACAGFIKDSVFECDLKKLAGGYTSDSDSLALAAGNLGALCSNNTVAYNFRIDAFNCMVTAAYDFAGCTFDNIGEELVNVAGKSAGISVAGINTA